MKRMVVLLLCSLTVFLVSCKRELVNQSEAKAALIPIVIDYTPGIYISGLGEKKVFTSIPDTLGALVDSLYGFKGGFGGKTGSDTVYLLKSDVTDWPDTTKAGAGSITISKFDKFEYKNSLTVNILVLEPNTNPGPTDISGSYKRTSNSYIIKISKISKGIFFLDNPGGAGVAPHPYVLENYKSATGADSLAFAIQKNPCGGGLQLIGPSGALSGTSSADYSTMFPPQVVALAPFTLQWIVMEFDKASPSAISSGGALCQWGTSKRTFEKQ